MQCFASATHASFHKFWSLLLQFAVGGVPACCPNAVTGAKNTGSWLAGDCDSAMQFRGIHVNASIDLERAEATAKLT
jgi:hypothetical protein